MHLTKRRLRVILYNIEKQGDTMKNWLRNEWIILSGASSGIGRELTKIFIKRYGAKVFGIARNEQKMLSLKTELGENADNFD